MKRILSLLIVCLISLSSTALSQEVNELPRFVEVATAGTGGAYYPIGVAMAEILTKNLDTQATAQVTGGAVENVQLLQDGSVTIALTQSASAYKGLAGEAPYDAPKDRVSGLIGNLTQGVFQIVAREGSDIETLADLEGKRVGLGPAGGTGIELSTFIFNAAGFGLDDVRGNYTSYDEAVTALGDGNLDAVIIQTALPNPALRQLEAAGKTFRLIPVPDDVMQQVNEEHPYYDITEIPADVYGTDAPIPTMAGSNVVIIDRNLSEEAVYQIVKTLFENIDVIRNSHPAAQGLSLEAAPDLPVPLHPGAERYYREMGVLN